MNETLLAKVKDYLEFGWSLLPMQFVTGEDGKTSKKPMVAWKKYQTERAGLEEVTSWLDKGWFLGIVTGEISGVVIVDDDRVKNGLTPSGLNTPIVARTKSGGNHFYYKYDRLITNHANANIHIDIRGNGGYCVLPPFNDYTWLKEPTKESLEALMSLPKKVEDRINEGKRAVGEPVRISDYEKLGVGQRNQELHRVACSIWNNKQLSDKDKVSQIMWFNETRCDPPLPLKDVETIIASASSFVRANPILEASENPTDTSVKPLDLKTVFSMNLSDMELAKDCPQTGLPTLDRMVKGFVPGHTYTLTGNTNVGKTSVACFFACSVALQQKKVLYLSLEPDTGVVQYMASIIHDKTFDDLKKEDFNFDYLPIEIFTKQHIRDVNQLLKVLREGPRYDLVVVDHIGYFVKNTTNTNQEQSNVMKTIAEIATSQKMAVLVIAHLRKGERKKKQSMPTMDDISGSGSFKQDSTDVWILHKELDESDETRSRHLDKGFLIVAKSKNSTSGPIKIAFGQAKAGIKEFVSDPFYGTNNLEKLKRDKETLDNVNKYMI